MGENAFQGGDYYDEKTMDDSPCRALQ